MPWQLPFVLKTKVNIVYYTWQIDTIGSVSPHSSCKWLPTFSDIGQCWTKTIIRKYCVLFCIQVNAEKDTYNTTAWSTILSGSK